MTGEISFGPDCSSFQGAVDWMAVSAVCRFGAEKVTEGTGYVNPRWSSSRRAMEATADRSRFVPLAYLFLDAAENGRAQARFFAEHAGDLAHFGIGVDFERAPNGPPTLAEAHDAVDELRSLYPHHPVGGYMPHWYVGAEDVSFVNWLWASSYITGAGDPGMLYGRVPAAFWAPYGGRHVSLLQFTDQALIAGITGYVDCSAFHGDRNELERLVLPRPASPPPGGPGPTAHGDDGMLIHLLPGAVPVSFPVWADAAAYKEPQDAQYVSLVLAGDSGAVVQAVLYHSDGAPEQFSPSLVTGQDFAVVPQRGWATVRTVRLQRLDKQSLGASAVFRTW